MTSISWTFPPFFLHFILYRTELFFKYQYKRIKHALFTCFSECVLSFGYNCQQKCNENCINRTCNKVNGSCLHGCKGDNTCKLGESGIPYSSHMTYTAFNSIHPLKYKFYI